MRNVVKGFQVSKMAVPRAHLAAINKHFDVYHAPHLRMSLGRPPAAKHNKMPAAPGRNMRGKR